MGKYVDLIPDAVPLGLGEDALAKQLRERVADETEIAGILQAGSERLDLPESLVRLAKKEEAAIRAEPMIT